jgi:bifunctional UDP-N-acetylglucosamine pyrophosphorylase/glucosamine-1-phosphate N-acetyltransferase
MDADVTVVVMAAGLGTRMRSRQAKVLHKAGGLTLVEHVLAAAAPIGSPERTFVVVGHQAMQVRALLEGTGIGFIDQPEQKGTGHAVLCGRAQLEKLPGFLMVLNGDGPLLRTETLTELVRRAQSSGAAAVMMTADLEDPTGYGRIVRDAQGNVHSIVEQKAGTPEQLAIRESNTGQYCFKADLFWKHIDELHNDNPAHEYYLTDMIGILIRAGHKVEPFQVADSSELMGINNRVELAAVDAIFRARKVRELMLGGATIYKPETVTVDGNVTVGMDTVIEPFVRLLGNTRIGENCRIGACSVLTDAEIEDDVEVNPFTSVQEATVRSHAHIGPYSRIRPGSEVGAGAHIGNFVELKKAYVGGGAKAMHLAYLGDCAIGERTNIGAGTITCNYDGVRKHHTGIGKDAFVGSNSTLVAPVDIEDGAYVGAGSVITEHVPEGALALGRARQVVKEGWVDKKRATR